METQEMESMLRLACNSPALCQLNALVRDLTGLGLLVVWCRGGEMFGQIPVCDNERDLPQFCRILHEIPLGLQRCITCHSLLALAARNRGQIMEGRCHGGACVIASPVTGINLPQDVDLVVISSCAFILADRKKGWRMTRRMASDLGLDLTQLRRAYEHLPGLPDAKREMVIKLVSLAAAILSDAFQGRLPIDTDAKPVDSRQKGMEAKLSAALMQAHKPEFRNVSGSLQTTMVSVVQSVVGANPHLPVTVADVARAAQITPNHFSLIFRRQTGITFSEFLAEKRFECSLERLRDLTLSIAQVARQAGFSDPNYFAKIFRKRTGLSPREWRRQNLNKIKQKE
jgi:AraC-like DNA-binding protein